MPGLTFVQKFAVWALPVLFAITVHEVSHGWVASKLGDKTAQKLGRLTLNPIKHIDPLGTILIPALLLLLGGFIFGWAKPVPVDARNLRNPKRDMAIVAAAGPLSNFIMALMWAGITKLGTVLLGHQLGWATALIYMGQAGIFINLVLMILNFIPIPPLDGSHVLASLLPNRAAYLYEKIAPFGFFIILGLLATGLLSMIIGPPITHLFTMIQNLFGI